MPQCDRCESYHAGFCSRSRCETCHRYHTGACSQPIIRQLTLRDEYEDGDKWLVSTIGATHVKLGTNLTPWLIDCPEEIIIQVLKHIVPLPSVTPHDKRLTEVRLVCKRFDRLASEAEKLAAKDLAPTYWPLAAAVLPYTASQEQSSLINTWVPKLRAFDSAIQSLVDHRDANSFTLHSGAEYLLEFAGYGAIELLHQLSPASTSISEWQVNLNRFPIWMVMSIRLAMMKSAKDYFKDDPYRTGADGVIHGLNATYTAMYPPLNYASSVYEALEHCRLLGGVHTKIGDPELFNSLKMLAYIETLNKGTDLYKKMAAKRLDRQVTKRLEDDGYTDDHAKEESLAAKAREIMANQAAEAGREVTVEWVADDIKKVRKDLIDASNGTDASSQT